jgi:hypothetical protein
MNQDRPIYAPLTWTDEQEQEQPQAEPQSVQDSKIFIVEAISMFRMRYAVRCKNAEHAADTVVMNEANELSQQHLDEVISSTRQVTEAEYLQIFDADNDYLSTWNRDQKMNMIHTVDYDKQG